MTYEIVSGPVAGLRISAGFDDLGFTSVDRSLAGGGDILAAAAGNAIRGTGLSGASSGGDVSMEFFACTVGSQKIYGRFHKIGFADGDLIDFVVKNEDGKLMASAARDPAKRCICVQPYKTRGNVAQKRHDVFWGALISFGLPLLAAGYFTYRSFENLNRFSWIGAATGVLLFFIFALMNYLARSQFYPASFDATEIFKSLGFVDPANVDLPKGLREAEKQWAERTGGGYVPDVPWRYRY